MTELLHITERDGWERAAGDGEQYPHIYGPVPAGAVTEVIPVGRDAAGRLILPGPALDVETDANAAVPAHADPEADRPDRAGSG